MGRMWVATERVDDPALKIVEIWPNIVRDVRDVGQVCNVVNFEPKSVIKRFSNTWEKLATHARPVSKA